MRTHELHRWENQVADGYPLEDLDFSEVERTHRMAVDVKRLDAPFTSAADTLDRFQLRRDGRLLRAAVVLFGRRQMPDYPQCALRMARFRGTTKNEFIDQRQIFGHAFQILEEASLFLERHVPVAGWLEEGKSAVRVAIPNRISLNKLAPSTFAFQPGHTFRRRE